MHRRFKAWPLMALALLILPVQAQQIQTSNQIWSAEVIRSHGQPVIPLFDGWYPNADGSKTICFGYFNMNTDQALDLPAGDTNYLETDYPDLDLDAVLLPTHFDPLPPAYRHVFCAFTITVPEAFGIDHRITWHLASNGQSLSVPGKVIAPYVMDEPASDGRGDVAPVIQLSADTPPTQGRTGLIYPQIMQTRVGEALALSARIDHPDEEVWIGWAHHSGPGPVSFSDREYSIDSRTRTETELRFSTPGDYVVRLQSIDDIAAFEFYCCHSNAYYRVRVSE